MLEKKNLRLPKSNEALDHVEQDQQQKERDDNLSKRFVIEVQNICTDICILVDVRHQNPGHDQADGQCDKGQKTYQNLIPSLF